jgi:hypothetical protein
MSRICRSSGNRWLVWIPVMMVAALLYWTVALGLGGLSLMAVSTLSGAAALDDAEQLPEPTATEPAPGETPVVGVASGSSIVVNLQESAEPEDVDDNAGAASDDAADDAAVVAPAQGPGATSF